MEENVRPMGRTASGVRGIKITKPDNYAVGMIIINPEVEQRNILVVSEKGNGKQSLLEEYRLTSRGGKGVKTMQVTKKTGNVAAVKAVTESDDLMIIKKSGVTIRFHLSDLRTMGRATQGVRLLRVTEKDGISSVAKVPREEEEEIQEGIEGVEGTEGNIENVENTKNTEDLNEEEGKGEE